MNGSKDDDVIAALTGLNVHVEAGPILRDVMIHPLVREGAIDILDRLRARGFDIARKP